MARLPFPAADSAACKAAAAIHRGHDDHRPDQVLLRAALGREQDNGAISEVGAWARRNHVDVIAGEFGASRELNRDSAGSLARRGAQRLRKAGVRMGAVGAMTTLWDLPQNLRRPPAGSIRSSCADLVYPSCRPANSGKQKFLPTDSRSRSVTPPSISRDKKNPRLRAGGK